MLWVAIGFFLIFFIQQWIAASETSDYTKRIERRRRRRGQPHIDDVVEGEAPEEE
jgi:hypothetical protein